MAVYRIPVTIENPNLPSPAVNVWHGRVDTSDILGQDWTSPTSIIGALHDWYTAMAGRLAEGSVVRFPDAVIETTTAEEAPIDVPDPITVAAGGRTAPGLAIVISWRTGTAARRGRGRTFLGPLSAANIDSTGQLQASYEADAITATNALLAASSGVNGWALGVWGQQTKGVLEPKILRDFQSFTVRREFAHLRSRRD